MPYRGDFTGGAGGTRVDDDDAELAHRERRREQSFGVNLVVQALHRASADQQRKRDDAEARRYVVAKLRRRR